MTLLSRVTPSHVTTAVSTNNTAGGTASSAVAAAAAGGVYDGVELLHVDWVQELPEDLDVCIAQRDFEAAVDLIQKSIFPFIITGSAVALHCVKAHRQSQWRSPNFNPL